MSHPPPTDAEWERFKAALDHELEQSVPRLTTQHAASASRPRKGVVLEMKVPVARPDRVCIGDGPPIHIEAYLTHSGVDGQHPTTIYASDGMSARTIKWTPTTPFTETDEPAGKIDTTFAVIKGVGHLVFDHTKVIWSSPHSVYVGLTTDDGIITDNPSVHDARLNFIYDADSEALMLTGLAVTPRESGGRITRMNPSSTRGMMQDMLSGMSPDERAQWDANMRQINGSMVEDATSVVMASGETAPAATGSTNNIMVFHDENIMVFYDETTPTMLGIATPPDQVGTSSSTSASTKE